MTPTFPKPSELATASRHLVDVPFEGDGAATGALNWGQQHILGAIRNLGSPMNMCAVRELTPPASVQDFADELRFYLERFQAMRTLLRFSPDAPPVQEVLAAGLAPLEVVDLPADADAARAAAELVAEHEQRPFDDENELPIRMVLVRRDGVLTHLVTVLNHFATDGAGAFVMYEDYLRRDPVTGAVPEPVRTHPLDLTAQQASPAGRRQSDASLRYWEKALTSLPPTGQPAPVEREGARYRRVALRSVPMMLGATRIAHRLECDVSAVLLALFSTALARVTGTRPAAAQMLVSNRFRPGMADVVGNVSQTGLFVVDVAGATVDEVVDRAQRAVTRTYKHAYFDLAQWRELLADVERKRGEPLALCYYNDRPSQRSGTAPGREPSAEAVRAAAAVPTPATWTELPFFNERLMVTIDNVDEAGDAIPLLVYADTWHVPPEDMEALARLMESLAVAAACDPGTPTGIV
ncbi:condensation domain-containing protein [Catenulispora subtropica]|uniref:Condensation domain-containing protein n=1 Tax=Catenulispora subtropica TaxID=450798 RepID=A0ABN2SD10_9ACTN